MGNEKNEDMKKKVDEAWKESVVKDKDSVTPPADGARAPEATFGLFIYGLMMEAMIALGEVEHPVTKKKEKNDIHAKFVIDTLGMLGEKTKGNLTKDESEMLDAMLYDLRMRFLQKPKEAKL